MGNIAGTELQMLSIWREILENDEIGYEDNFFEAGGNSLYAMELLKRIQTDFKVEIAVADLFDCRNVREVAAVIEEYRAEAGE